MSDVPGGGSEGFMMRCALFVWVGLILSTVSTAFAQDMAPTAEIFAGYSMTSQSGDVLHGGNLSLTANFTDLFGIVADISGHRISEAAGIPGVLSAQAAAKVTSLRFGPKLTWRGNSRITPFAHVLVGGARLSVGSGFQIGSATFSASDAVNGWAMAIGGGADVNVGRRWAIRIIQIERSGWKFEGQSLNGLRASFGLVLKFGQPGY